MPDLLVRAGLIIGAAGHPSFRGDAGVWDRLIVALGTVEKTARAGRAPHPGRDADTIMNASLH